MDSIVTETKYPLAFRQEDATYLGDQLQHRHSIEMIGMKRVGISNFLRFFLNHRDIKKKYLPKDGKNLFIAIDLNDLIEREVFPFWRLTFKRIVDIAETLPISDVTKKHISELFVSCIQSGDLFLTYDGVRESLVALTRANFYPTLFFIRFDRLKDALTPEFLDNLYGLLEATNQKSCYVFTSFRELDKIAPHVFEHKDLSVFSHKLYLKPAKAKDTQTIFATFAERFGISFTQEIKKLLLDFSGGHAQYLQLLFIVFQECMQKNKNCTKEDVLMAIENDERLALQSEELWESLNSNEQVVLQKIANSRNVTHDEKQAAIYLWNTGFVQGNDGIYAIFSPMFGSYIRGLTEKKQIKAVDIDFSKKEHMLFQLLKEHVGEICEREKIVSVVWPEYKEYGVSDWSIDRLVARVRGKLKKQKSMYEITTVRTRGYKLVTV